MTASGGLHKAWWHTDGAAIRHEVSDTHPRGPSLPARPVNDDHLQGIFANTWISSLSEGSLGVALGGLKVSRVPVSSCVCDNEAYIRGSAIEIATILSWAGFLSC